jgi:hypothetical protein
MNWGYSSRSIAIAAAIIVAVGLSQFGNAQTPPAPQPSPSPSPSPSPAPSATQPPSPTPSPPPFHSQFNGDKDATSGEATDFGNLVSVYDAWQAAGDAVTKAKSCGTQADIAAAEKAFTEADSAWVNAAYQYIDDWSNNVFPQKGGPPFKGPGAARADPLFDADMNKLKDAIKKASKYVRAKVNDCPATPKKKSEILEDILGHVSIGVGGGHDHRGGDRPQSSDKPSTSTPPPSNETTYPSRD